MLGFEHYHQIIDLANNPDYNFISYNIDPDLVIYCDGFKRTIHEAYCSEIFPLVGERTKSEKSSMHLFISQSFVFLSIFAIIYMLLGLVRFFFFSGLQFDEKLLWFIIFGFAFLIPLLLGFFKLIIKIVSANKNYKNLEYQTFILSNRMLFDKRVATLYEISSAVDNLTYYFELNYSHFDNGKRIKKFFEKRYQRIPLTFYGDLKKHSIKYLTERKSSGSMIEVVVELIIGLLGTIFNIIKDYSIIAPAMQKIIGFMVISIILVLSIAYLIYCIDVIKMGEVSYYYYIYSYLFLESSTNKKANVTYSFNFIPNEKNGELLVFTGFIYETIKKNKIPVFERDVEILFKEGKTFVIFYGVEKDDQHLKDATNNESFDAFFDWIGGKRE